MILEDLANSTRSRIEAEMKDFSSEKARLQAESIALAEKDLLILLKRRSKHRDFQSFPKLRRRPRPRELSQRSFLSLR